MLGRIATALWGKFESREEVQKFGLLAVIFGFIIGNYWALRPIKDSIFGTTVGVDYQPWAKWLSVLVIVPLVLLYSKLIDTFPRHKVFYGLVAAYAFMALAFSAFFMHPTIGLANTVESPSRIIGWLWYVYVESYGSLIVALFWTITTDITKPEAAKRGFPLIVMFGQMGNILGPWLLRAKRLGFANSAPIVGICGLLTLMILVTFWFFLKVTPKKQLESYHATDSGEAHSEPGFFEGLRLILSKGYLLGIFFVVSIYEIIITVFDFQLKAEGKAVFPAEADLSEFLQGYATWTGIIATLCVIFGINNIQRKLGMTVSLMLIPVLVAVAAILVYMSAGNPQHSLNFIFWIMVSAKAVNYSLNGPSLKQLYIPTSRDAKYKSQAWIEMFGSRGAKAAGSGINMLRGSFIGSMGRAAGIPFFISLCTGIHMCLVVVWLFVALYVSKKYNSAIKENKVVC